jgi:hypothetical protein
VRNLPVDRRVSLTVLFIVLAALAASPAAAQPQAPGRVLVTVTTLEGTVNLAGVEVELRSADDMTAIAKTTTDAAGRVSFPDVPVGRYVVTGSRAGFTPRDSAVFHVRGGETARVLLDIQLTFVVPAVEVRGNTPSPTDSVQPVSMSDMLAGSVFELAPLAGDDFQSLMLLLPGVVRGPDGRLRVKGGQPSQSALQVSTFSLNDPSSGDFDLDLPSPSVQSVEVLANPFAAEYGRFSSSVTQVRTRRGTNDWEIKPGSLLPRFRSSLSIRAFEPNFSLHGPLRRDRVFLAEDVQFRYVATPVDGLPDKPEIELKSFDTFTRIDTVISARHTLGGGVISFPRTIRKATMNTFRPPEVTPDFSQSGFSTAAIDRLALSPTIVLDTTLAVRWFEINANDRGRGEPMVYAPQTQSGAFFNDQEREVNSTQWVESVSISRDWRGPHVIKIGTDLQRSAFDGFSESRPVEIRRLDGSLAELTTFGPRTEQSESGFEFAAFVQDRWRAGDRVTFEAGFRVDRDEVVERFNYSPRAGVAISIAPEGRAILRGGYGKFVQRTALNVGAFPTFEPRTIERFAVNGAPLGPAITYLNTIVGDLRTPEAGVGNVEWNQRFGRRTLLKVEFMRRGGTHEWVVTPNPAAGRLELASAGASAYRELEVTTRYLGGERRDLTVSYVWARGTADLNNYDQFFGNVRNPIIRPDENNLIPTDVRHRLLVRGTIGIGGKWDFAPIAELRSGFPYSAVNEFQDFVGARNRAGRLPVVHTLDFTIARPWQFRKYRFRAGIKVYNAFGSSAERDVQNNTTSPQFGQFFNPIERSIGFLLGAVR